MTRSFARGVGQRVTASITAAVCLVIVSGADARAQTPAVELRGGYAYVADSEFNFPAGWYAEVGVPLPGAVAILAEIGRSATTVVERGVPVTLSVTSFHGGVRLEKRSGPFQPFGTAMGGITRAGGHVNLSPALGLGNLDFNVSSRAYTMQMGGGVVVPVTPRFGVTVAGDYRWGVGDLGPLTEFRFSTGVQVGLGRR
jgi:hypothetical protein